jgi:hypothetical protein
MSSDRSDALVSYGVTGDLHVEEDLPIEGDEIPTPSRPQDNDSQIPRPLVDSLEFV